MFHNTLECSTSFYALKEKGRASPSKDNLQLKLASLGLYSVADDGASRLLLA